MNSNKIIALQFFSNLTGNVTKITFSKKGSSSVASIRLQLIPCIKAAKSRNLETEVWSLHNDKIDDQILTNKHLACIVGKLSTHTHLQSSMYVANSAALSRFKDMDIPIISIYSDNHARKGDLNGTLYRQILNISSAIVCPTHTLRQAAHQFNTRANICVIEDPWQIQEMKKMRGKLDKFIRIVWFGSFLNWKYMSNKLTETWKHLEPSKIYIFNILSAKKVINMIKKDVINSNPPFNVQIQIIEWSNFDQPNQLEKILESSDIALVPSDPNDPAKQGVSHNRVVDAVRSGCVVIASPMPSYKEIEKLAVIGDNIPKLLGETIENFSSLSDEISQSRKIILERFSPESNAKKWGDVMDGVLNPSIGSI